MFQKVQSKAIQGFGILAVFSTAWVAPHTEALAVGDVQGTTHRIQRSEEMTADQIKAEKLQEEFWSLRDWVDLSVSEGKVGGLLNYATHGDTILLWRTIEDGGSYDLIRLQRERPDGTTLDISYYGNATHIIEGRTVIRRFVGTFGQAFRNDTVDMLTGEYLGAQGVRTPRLDERDQEILRDWKIELFN